MDSNELHYVSYDPEAIWTAMQEAYVEAGGTPLYPGDEKEMLLRSVQADIVSVFAGIDNALRMQTLRYAVGDYLDTLGESRGCERLEAKAATGHIQILFKAAENVDASFSTIKAGTLLTVEGDVNYAIDDDVTVGAAGTYGYATITCTQAGAIGNGLANGQHMVLADGSNPYVVSIETRFDGTSGGRDKETDEEYRVRLRTFMNEPFTVGTKAQYEQAVMDYDPRVNQAYARMVSGAAIVEIVCDQTNVEQTVANGAGEYMRQNGMTALGTQLTVRPATALSYTLNMTVVTSDTAAANKAVQAYQAWQDNVLGRAFVPEKLVGMLYEAGCTSVSIAITSRFNGGTAAYTTIEPYERCSGTVTLS